MKAVSGASGATILFLHVNKTGGTSLTNIIHDNYPLDRVCRLYYTRAPYEQEFHAKSAAEKMNFQVVISHQGFSRISEFPNEQPLKVVTLLRDPLARARSHVNHFRSHTFPQSVLSLEELMKETNPETGLPCALYLDNLQVRLLSGIPHGTAVGSLTECHLQQAEEHLRTRIDLVGITEMFWETLFLFSSELDWKSVKMRRDNQSSKQNSLRPHKEDEALYEMTRLDQRLYDTARNLFLERLADMGEDWQQQVKEFKQSVQLDPIVAMNSFNPQKYLEHNPDVARSQMEPSKHYFFHGQFEGRPGTPALYNQQSKSTMACLEPWRTELLDADDSCQLCPRVELPSQKVSRLKVINDIQTGLLIGEPTPACQNCPLKSAVPLHDFVEYFKEHHEVLSLKCPSLTSD